MIRNVLNIIRHLLRGGPEVGTTPADTIHRENKWELRRYRPAPDVERLEADPVLLVPSLINRHYILDLIPRKSFVQYLLGQGHDVYIIDWGRPTAEDRFLTLDDYCDTYLGRAVRKVARRSPSGKIQLLGYCLGGTLTTIYAAAHPEHIAKMALLAAPVDFHDHGLLSTWGRTETVDVDAIVDGFGNMPWPLMQFGFQMLRPTMNLSKAVYALDRGTDDRFLEGFLALETWSNDNVSFPGEAFRRYIGDLYGDNQLVEDEFALSGRRIYLSDIECPVLNVTFEHDHIVPAESAKALNDHVGDELMNHVHLYGGHVGSVISSKADENLWPVVEKWFAGESSWFSEDDGDDGDDKDETSVEEAA